VNSTLGFLTVPATAGTFRLLCRGAIKRSPCAPNVRHIVR
jgi:hypothetical protein